MRFFLLCPALLLSGNLLFTSTPLQAAPYFVQCPDFGCKTTRELQFEPRQWQQIRALFANGIVDNAADKQAIRQTVALMKRFTGELSGTYQDKGGNYPGYDIPGQIDCIDESTNTFQNLSALQDLDLLKWHRVGLRQRRILWFASPSIATIREIDGNQRFAVDSWYRDNGELPFIQPLADWLNKRDFSVDYNPELAANK